MATLESGSSLSVEIVYSPAGRQVLSWLREFSVGTTLQEALLATLFKDLPEVQSPHLAIGIWGKKATLHHILRQGDRVEVYRKLRVDPKVARRERFNRQGAKTAGLFAKTRLGAKAGY